MDQRGRPESLASCDSWDAAINDMEAIATHLKTDMARVVVGGMPTSGAVPASVHPAGYESDPLETISAFQPSSPSARSADPLSVASRMRRSPSWGRRPSIPGSMSSLALHTSPDPTVASSISALEERAHLHAQGASASDARAKAPPLDPSHQVGSSPASVQDAQDEQQVPAPGPHPHMDNASEKAMQRLDDALLSLRCDVSIRQGRTTTPATMAQRSPTPVPPRQSLDTGPRVLFQPSPEPRRRASDALLTTPGCAPFLRSRSGSQSRPRRTSTEPVAAPPTAATFGLALTDQTEEPTLCRPRGHEDVQHSRFRTRSVPRSYQPPQNRCKDEIDLANDLDLLLDNVVTANQSRMENQCAPPIASRTPLAPLDLPRPPTLVVESEPPAFRATNASDADAQEQVDAPPTSALRPFVRAITLSLPLRRSKRLSMLLGRSDAPEPQRLPSPSRRPVRRRSVFVPRFH